MGKFNAEAFKEAVSKDQVLPKNERGPGASIGGYFVSLGLDSEKYGSGQVTIMQGKSLLAKFSYVDWQKLDAFISENADLFNTQLDKELVMLQVVKRR